MKKIKLSNFVVTEQEYSEIEFTVDIDFTIKEILFKNCKFLLTETGNLVFNTCKFENCIFQGIQNLDNYKNHLGKIHANECNFLSPKLKGQFKHIYFSLSSVNGLNDESIAKDFLFINIEIRNFSIKGECENIQLLEATFLSSENKVSIWDKKVIKRAQCRKTIFDNVKINPFYLATKCEDKSSLDLSRATLIDDWSRLRKKYAGLSLFIVFLLTFLFFLPLITHSFFLLAISKIDPSILNIELIPLWQSLLFGGKVGWQAIAYSLLTIVLLVYNIGRLYMTISISKLREEENFLRDAQFHLVSIHPEKFRIQLEIDKILSVLFWISIGYTLLKLVDTLMIGVPAFKN